MDRKYLVCVICCKEFKCGGGGGDSERKKENVESLQQFCEVILEVDKSELEGNGGLKCFHGNYKRFKGKEGDGGGRDGFGDDVIVKEEDDKQNNLWKFLNNPDDNLSICENCLDLIKVVTEARLSAKCVEESVEKLQVLLLRELRRLQGRLDMFWREFEKMEETLVNGDLKFMGNNLNESYSGRMEEGGICQEHLDRSKEIVGFRVKISKVFRDFHQFHSKSVDKIACNPEPVVTIRPTKPISLRRPKTVTTAPSKKMVKVKKKPKLKQKTCDKQLHKDNDKALSSPSPVPPAVIETRHDNDEDDKDWDSEDGPMHLDNFNDKDNCSENIKVEAKLVDLDTDKQPYLPGLEEDKDKRKFSDSGQEDDSQNSAEDDNDDEYVPETSKSSSRAKRKQADKRGGLRRRRRQNKKKDKPKSSDSEEVEFSEDNEEEYNPKPMNNMNLGYVARTIKTLFRSWLRENGAHLLKMSPFKRNLVENIIKCQHLHEYIQKKKGLEKMNVFKQHMVHLSYNLETQLINLKDIPIKILCQTDGESETNGLLCMKCELKVPEGPKMQKLMFDHVLSKHLNAYHCPHCKIKQLESYHKYANHLRTCPEVSKVDCDICGKTLVSASLQHHKWGHMNEEERAEALKSGKFKKDPLLNSIKGKDKMYQCTKCGKSLATKQSLQNHEEIHLDKKLREQWICAKCGKSFLKGGYEYHLKYGESCGEMDARGRRVSCGKCGKILKNKTILGHHMRWMHRVGESNAFCCATCGKCFEKRGSWIRHEKIHLEERRWICGKCGKGFKIGCHLKRHERTCVK